MKYNSPKRNAILLFAAAWLRTISEISQAQKDKGHLSLTGALELISQK